MTFSVFFIQVAGKDGTKLFDKYHSFVNVDFIMEKCLVGFLKEGETGVSLYVTVCYADCFKERLVTCVN